MKVGDLVRLKHFIAELGVVVRLHENGTIDVRAINGDMWYYRRTNAFKVLK